MISNTTSSESAQDLKMSNKKKVTIVGALIVVGLLGVELKSILDIENQRLMAQEQQWKDTKIPKILALPNYKGKEVTTGPILTHNDTVSFTLSSPGIYQEFRCNHTGAECKIWTTEVVKNILDK